MSEASASSRRAPPNPLPTALDAKVVTIADCSVKIQRQLTISIGGSSIRRSLVGDGNAVSVDEVTHDRCASRCRDPSRLS